MEKQNLLKMVINASLGCCPDGAYYELKKIQAVMRGDYVALAHLHNKQIKDLQERLRLLAEENENLKYENTLLKTPILNPEDHF